MLGTFFGETSPDDPIVLPVPRMAVVRMTNDHKGIGGQALPSAWTYDVLTDVTTFSERFAELVGFEADERIGTMDDYWAYVHENDVDEAKSDFSRVLRSAGSYPYSHRVTTPDGETRLIKGSWDAVAGPAGVVVRVMGSVNEAIRTDETVDPVARDEERWRLAIEGSNEGVWDIDTTTGEAWFCSNFYEMLGYSASDFQATLSNWIDLVHLEDKAQLRRTFDTQAKFSTQVRVARKEGTYAWIWVRGQSVRDEEGRIIRIVGTNVDISDSKREEQRLRDGAEMLRAASEGSQDSLLILRTARNRDGIASDFVVVEMNSSAEALMGLARGEAIGKLLGQIAPATRTDGFLEKCLTVFETQKPAEEKIHIVMGGLREVWMRYEMVPLPDGIAISASDVTQRKRAELAIQRSERFMQRIAEATPNYMYIWDFDSDRMVYRNRDFLLDLGYSQSMLDDMGQQPIWPLLHPDDRHTLRIHLKDLKSKSEIVLRLRARDGRYRWFHCNHSVFERNASGEATQALGVALDVTEQKEYELEIEQRMELLRQTKSELEARQKELEELNVRLNSLAWTDGLTGLKNHRAFQERLGEEVERALRYGSKLSLVLADVDHFKLYNDRFGHPAGDSMLKEFADVLLTASRSSDFVVRYGGEEFALILPETSAEEAACLAERIRVALKLSPLGQQNVTASYGCAELKPGREAKSHLVAEADRALYESKHAGRDRVTLASARTSRAEES